MNQDPRTRENAGIVLQAMKNRRSIRNYTGEAIAKEDLDLIIEAALTSATGHGYYAYKLLATQDQELCRQLSGCRVGAADMLKEAGAAVVVMSDEGSSDTWIEDVSIVLTNMHLLADALGYGSCWIQIRSREAANGENAESAARRILGLPETCRVEAILAIGVPAKEKAADDAARQKKRAELAKEKVQYR